MFSYYIFLHLPELPGMVDSSAQVNTAINTRNRQIINKGVRRAVAEMDGEAEKWSLHVHKQDVKRRRAPCTRETPTKDPFKTQEKLQGFEMFWVYKRATGRVL